MNDLSDLFDEAPEEDTSLGLERQGDMEATKSQVLPVLSEGASPSLLSPDTLRALVKESELSEEAMAASFLMEAAPQMHTTSGIVDFATVVCLAVAQGKMKISQSAEMRKWAELMFTCVMAEKPKEENTQVNYVQQLIQLAGGPQSLDPQVVEVRNSVGNETFRANAAKKIKKAQGE